MQAFISVLTERQCPPISWHDGYCRKVVLIYAAGVGIVKNGPTERAGCGKPSTLEKLVE
jgi:hypothetical protein